uniref:BTB domain-containing protein n=1 Tax=Myripristis murdjan TaxID=586833 RepID=A0A668B033_9TELE
MRERSKSVIKLTGIDCDVLGVLVNYMYSARVCITESNVQSLLEAADLLQLNSVKQACEEFLVRFLDVDNCLGMHAFAQLHVCPALEREARRVMLSRFMELIQEEEFLELDREKMQSVLAGETHLKSTHSPPLSKNSVLDCYESFINNRFWLITMVHY